MAKHLSLSDRISIRFRLNDGWNIRKIAKEIHRSPATVCDEIKRNSVNGIYDPNFAQYLAN